MLVLPVTEGWRDIPASFMVSACPERLVVSRIEPSRRVKINKAKSSSILLYERRTNHLAKDIVSLCKRESEKDFPFDIFYLGAGLAFIAMVGMAGLIKEN
jgi:hypothetical protein